MMDSSQNSGWWSMYLDDHMRHQAGSGDALVDDSRRHRRLDERLAFEAGPLASHVPLDREAAR
jgi:hypothetical protein